MMRERRRGEKKRRGEEEGSKGLGQVTTDFIHIHFKKYKNQ